MDYVDKTLVCSDCQAEFVHSAAAQQRYAERGFASDPKRCPTCRDKRKSERTGGGGEGGAPRPRGPGGGSGGASRPPRQFYQVVCAECGKQTEVPFKPMANRPVYCRTCYMTKKND
jgi:CxxC-x17-CxxC domain-containing protein